MTSGRMLKISGSIVALGAGWGLSGSALANDDVTALVADPGNVVMPSITYNGWNYSTLDQITLDNVDQLQIAWTWQV
ncbi:MAG: PQQ-dependent dehydrogenase, methanol/ethanol family, partial [Bauldia sp.]|nr:PQQ-dependent dehydrogenase, methanol/ethanol family [Bauldia sp.]